jgi:hypothetical protein
MLTYVAVVEPATSRKRIVNRARLKCVRDAAAFCSRVCRRTAKKKCISILAYEASRAVPCARIFSMCLQVSIRTVRVEVTGYSTPLIFYTISLPMVV